MQPMLKFIQERVGFGPGDMPQDVVCRLQVGESPLDARVEVFMMSSRLGDPLKVLAGTVREKVQRAVVGGIDDLGGRHG